MEKVCDDMLLKEQVWIFTFLMAQNSPLNKKEKPEEKSEKKNR